MKMIFLTSFFLAFFSNTLARLGDDKFELERSYDSTRMAFSQFLEHYNKKYSNADEFEHRLRIFDTNLKTTILHNENKQHTFQMGINQFSDLEAHEFSKTYLGGLMTTSGNMLVNASSSPCKPFINNIKTISESMDWRIDGVVTPVKDQGSCGSCWAFSAIASIESAIAIYTSDLRSFSEQQLVDCTVGDTYGNKGCHGGIMNSAFQFVMETADAICTESSYPYTSGVKDTLGQCHFCDDSHHTITGCMDVTHKNEVDLKAAVSLQPVSIAVDATEFQHYNGGIMLKAACGTKLNHGVTIVGYGVDSSSGIAYWNIKNSWGTSWGEQGYIRLERSDSTTSAGTCGLAMEPSFPTVK